MILASGSHRCCSEQRIVLPAASLCPIERISTYILLDIFREQRDKENRNSYLDKHASRDTPIKHDRFSRWLAFSRFFIWCALAGMMDGPSRCVRVISVDNNTGIFTPRGKNRLFRSRISIRFIALLGRWFVSFGAVRDIQEVHRSVHHILKSAIVSEVAFDHQHMLPK